MNKRIKKKMNEELEEWIELNVQVANNSHEGLWWAKGARAMAEHLCEQGRIENDAAFLLGMEAANKIAPTCEHIAKVWRLCNLSFSPRIKDMVDYTQKHWNDEPE